MFNYFVYSLCIFGLLTLIINKLVGLNKNRNRLIISIIIFSLIMSYLHANQTVQLFLIKLGAPVFIKNLIFTLIYYAFIKLNSKAELREGTFITLIFSTISFIAFTFALNSVRDLNQYNVYIDKTSINSLIIIMALSLNILVWLILLKLFKSKDSFKSISALIPIALPLVTIFILLNLRRYIWFNTRAITIVVILLLTNYIFIYLYIRNVIIMRNDIKERQNELEKKYLENKLSLQTMQYEKSFNLIHNMVNEMQDIKQKYDQANYSELGQEIDHLNNELIKEFNILYTNSKTLSVVLHNHLDEFTRNNIKIKTTLNYSDFTFMHEAEELELFEKIITYAINSCNATKDEYKFINIKSDLKNDSLVIKTKFNHSTNDDQEIINNLKAILKNYNALVIGEISDDKYYNLVIIFNINDIKDNLALENKIN